jgi:hypothetical protein
MQSPIQWSYLPPNADGTCPYNPDTHMLITSNAPGTCFVASAHPPYTCKQPDPLNQANQNGFIKQTNKDYAICAPACSSQTDCPDIGADPRSGKNLQGQPFCTSSTDSTEYTDKGHCVITPPIYTQSLPGIPDQHYDECEALGGNEMSKKLCDIMAHLLHRSPADNYLHIVDKKTCEKNYSNFLDNNPAGKRIASLLRDEDTVASRWLLEPSNWCSVDPAFPQGSVIDGSVTLAGEYGSCDVKQGTSPSSCQDVDCKSDSLLYNELGCRKNKDCCQWYLFYDNIMDYGTGYFPINKPSPSPPPPKIHNRNN